MRQKVKEVIGILSEVYDKPLSKTSLLAYDMILNKYTDQQLDRALKEILRSNVYASMPKPAEFVITIESSPDSKALIAWVSVLNAIINIGNYKSVEFDEPVIHQVIDAMGGWQEIAVHDKEETPFIEKRFLKLYETLSKRELEDKPRLLGYYDMINKKYENVVKITSNNQIIKKNSIEHATD